MNQSSFSKRWQDNTGDAGKAGFQDGAVETGKLIPQSQEESKAATKVAIAFNTNSTYVKDAKRLKTENPEAFEQIKSGEKTITEVKKVEKQIKREAAIAEHAEVTKPPARGAFLRLPM